MIGDVYPNLFAKMDRGWELQSQLQSYKRRRQINPLTDGGGGNDDTLTARGDRPSMYTVEAPIQGRLYPQRGGSR